MAKKEGVNKSQFIRDVLAKNATATAREVQEAWNATGQKEPLGTPIIYLVKSKFGKPSGRRGRPKGGADGVGVIPRSETSGVYLQIEAELDKLISKTPDSKITEALRSARRRVSARLI